MFGKARIYLYNFRVVERYTTQVMKTNLEVKLKTIQHSVSQQILKSIHHVSGTMVETRRL